MALPGVRKGDLRRVQSHPQALSQCDAYLSAMSGVVREAVSDTAGAAQAIAQNNQRWAALVPSCPFPAVPCMCKHHMGVLLGPSAQAYQAALVITCITYVQHSCKHHPMTRYPCRKLSQTGKALRVIVVNRDVAAIASERAAELYGMDILDRNIQDARDNITRFIVLSRDPLVALPDDPRTYKTSIVFSLPSSGPGEVRHKLQHPLPLRAYPVFVPVSHAVQIACYITE